MKKCVIVQYEGIHEEIIPSIIFVLNNLGYKPTILINAGYRGGGKGDIFKHITNVDYELVPIALRRKALFEKGLEIINRDKNFEFLVYITYQSNAIAKFLDNITIPKIVITHNAKKLLEERLCVKQINTEDIYLMTLSQHVAVYLKNNLPQLVTNIGYFTPFLMTNTVHDNFSLNEGPIRIGIAGGIDIRTRGFPGLIEQLALAKQNNQLSDRIKFVILGGGNDRKLLEIAVTENNLTDTFEFLPMKEEHKFVSYNEYNKAINKLKFLISIFPADYYFYVQFKISSVLSTAIAFEIPLLCEKKASLVYSVPGILYDGNNLSKLLKQIDDLSNLEYFALKKKMVNYRHQIMDEAIESFRNALDHLKIKEA